MHKAVFTTKRLVVVLLSRHLRIHPREHSWATHAPFSTQCHKLNISFFSEPGPHLHIHTILQVISVARSAVLGFRYCLTQGASLSYFHLSFISYRELGGFPYLSYSLNFYWSILVTAASERSFFKVLWCALFLSSPSTLPSEITSLASI